ncbi:MAG: hypothetical protein ACRC3Z_03435 [Phocaeicola sp.]
MKKILFLVGLVVILLLVKNCPEKQAHSDQLTTTLTNYLGERLGEYERINTFAQNLGTQLGSLVIDKAVDRRMTLTNFFLFNIAYLRWEEKNIPVSVGIFNHIIPMNEEEVLEALKQWSSF